MNSQQIFIFVEIEKNTLESNEYYYNLKNTVHIVKVSFKVGFTVRFKPPKEKLVQKVSFLLSKDSRSTLGLVIYKCIRKKLQI